MSQSNFSPPNDLDTTSTRLLSRVRQNDSVAWGQFVRLYGPVVRFWLRRARLNEGDLADVFQDVFASVHKSISQYERKSGTAKFRAWLKTVTQSKLHDHYRRGTKQPRGIGGSSAAERIQAVIDPRGDETQGLDVVPDSVDNSLAGSEEAFLIQRTLRQVQGQVSEKVWLAFYRTTVDERPSSEVAEELGMKSDAVRQAKARVLSRLRKALDHLDLDGESVHSSS